MALFIRVFISLFLFSNFAHAVGMGGSKTFKYYKTIQVTPQVCSESHQAVCAAHGSYIESQNAKTTINVTSCDISNTAVYIAYGKTVTEQQTYPPPTHDVDIYYPPDGNTRVIGTESEMICDDGQHLVLNGCTASCAVDTPPPDEDDCQSKKDTFVNLSVQCGSFQCPSGSKTVAYGGKIVCDKSPGSFSPSAVGSSAIKDGCELQAQALPDSFDINDARGLNSELGGQSQAGFCSVEYKFTGEPLAGNDTPTQEGGIGFNVSYLPRNPDGSCPASHPTSGEMNGENICAADSGTPSNDGTTCKDGSKRPSNGVCPSAGNGNGNDDSQGQGEGEGGDGEPCPTGQVKNAAGVCGAAGAAGGSGTCTSGSGSCSATPSSKCDTPPACNGDPLLCGSINQTWISTCKQTEALTKISTEDAKRANDEIVSSKAAHTTAQNNANTQANGFFSAFQSSVTSGSHTGQCIPNASLSVMGRSLVIPFAQACDFFKFLRMLIIALAYLAAAKIVFRGIS